MFAEYALYASLALAVAAALLHYRQERRENEQEERFWKALPEVWVKNGKGRGRAVT